MSRKKFIQQLPDWQQEIIEEWGITHASILFANIQLADDGEHIEYQCAYPPAIDDNDNVLYPLMMQKRILPYFYEPGDMKVITPSKENLHGGQMPPFYMPDYRSISQEIKLNGGIVYLGEGAKDAWTFYSAGLMNAISLFMANGAIYPSFYVYLKQMGVKTVKAFLDADFAGLETVISLINNARGTGITVEAYQIPIYMGDYIIKDINDLWNAAGHNTDEFLEILDDCRRMVIPSDGKLKYAKSNDYFTQELYDEIKSRLGLKDTEYNSMGWSFESCVCPHHQHEHDHVRPAYHWNDEFKIGHCWKRGQIFLAKDVATALGIDWKKYRNIDSENKVAPSIDSDETRDAQDIYEDQQASQLVIAGGILNNLRTATLAYSEVPDESIMYNLDDAFDNYIARISGAITSEYPPIYNPVSPMHKLGGLAHSLSRPLMVGILGLSGGFKTTFLTHIATELSKKGEHGIIWSPEWSPERNADRIIQMHGGLKMHEVSLLERWHWEHEIQKLQGYKNNDSYFGIKPKDSSVAESKELTRSVREHMKGKIYYLRHFGSNILEVLAMVVEISQRMSANGYPPSYFIFDYAQMALPPTGWQNWTMNDTIVYTKVITMQLGLVTFMASQVTKADSRRVLQDNSNVLDSSAGLYFRDDQFNLFMTLKPQNNIQQLPDGRVVDTLMLAVTKNSIGGKAASSNDALEMWVELNRMKIMEKLT